MIDANNYVYVNKLLSLNIDNVDRSVVENRIFTSGGTLSGVFAGDTILTGYWGVAINLNYGGFTNGIGGGNNARSYEPGYSAFTVNMRSSASQTTFDRRLFTVMPDTGNISCAGGLTTGNSNSFLGNLRINGTDYGNTLYQNTVNYDIGISTNVSSTSGGNIKFNTRAVTRMVIDGATGSVGIGNNTPWVDLNLGDVSVGGSSGSLVFGKNNGGGGSRQYRQGFSSNFFFCFGDSGNVNNSTAPWTLQMAISYQAPASSLTISSTGSVIMPNGWTSSDERIKTNIKTIENALEKTLLLRGVEYNNFKIELDKNV